MDENIETIRLHAFIRLRNDKNYIKLAISAYGNDTDPLIKATAETFDKVYEDYTQKGCNVAPIEKSLVLTVIYGRKRMKRTDHFYKIEMRKELSTI